MPLVECIDCGKQISDAAPACIHCGRPNVSSPPATRASTTGEHPENVQDSQPLAQRLRDRLKGVGDSVEGGVRSGWTTTRRYVKATGEAASEGWVWTREKTGQVVERIQSAPTQIAGLVFRDCPIPTYLLPTGPNEKDFVCLFDFDGAVAEMSRGTLVRPRIVAWAGRSDVDRAHLAAQLKDQFSAQFRARWKATLEAPESPLQHQVQRLESLERSKEKTASGIETAAKTLATGVGAMLLVTNPLADLVFLAIALFGGSSVVSGVVGHLRAATDLRRAEDTLESHQHELERELEVSNSRFREAVANIEVHIHPVLQEIVGEFNELEGQPYLPAEPSPDAPEVHPYLASSAYREQTPEWFHPLLNRHNGTL